MKLKHALLIVLAVLNTACIWRVTPDAGQEAVLTRKPWFFGSGGVASTPVETGSKWIFQSTNVDYVGMQPRTLVTHFDDMMSRDGVPLDFNAAFTYRVNDSVCMVEKFGVAEYEFTNAGQKLSWPTWFGNNLYKPLETAIRQAVRKHGMNETAIDTTAITDIDAEVTAQLIAELKQTGLCINLLEFTVGKANPPDSVKNQRIETAAQQQRVETEKQRKLAEDQRRMGELARAEADNAYRQNMNLTPEQFVTLQAIQTQREVCLKGGCTFVANGVNAVVGVR